MRLIDADALITHFKVLANMSYNRCIEPISWADAYERVADDIDYYYKIDAVPVVRCRDCKFFEQKSDPILEGDISYCEYHEHLIEESDFCSRGIRRDKQ